jgi:hypothetical protein
LNDSFTIKEKPAKSKHGKRKRKTKTHKVPYFPKIISLIPQIGQEKSENPRQKEKTLTPPLQILEFHFIKVSGKALADK